MRDLALAKICEDGVIGQHTFGATLRGAFQKAGEGWPSIPAIGVPPIKQVPSPDISGSVSVTG